MTNEQKKKLQQQLWNIADELRGKMAADEFRDYILGFIFFKYLSEKMRIYADNLLQQDNVAFIMLDEATDQGRNMLDAIRKEAVTQIGYFLKPSELFSALAERGTNGEFILQDLVNVLDNIESSTRGTESEEDFISLFEDMDLGNSKLGRSEQDKNDLIARVLTHLDKIDFELANSESDVLGDAYELSLIHI